MDLSKITDVKELKALAYDQIAAREVADRNLQAINQRLSELAQANTDKKPAEISKSKNQ